MGRLTYSLHEAQEGSGRDINPTVYTTEGVLPQNQRGPSFPEDGVE
jgi:hypothetical protein